MTVWVVVEDAHKAVGLQLPLMIVSPLIAACASDPSSFEELLGSADFYAHGLAGAVTDGLLAWDRRDGDRAASDKKVPRIAEEHPKHDLGLLLGRAGDDGLLYIDLTEHALVVHGRVAEVVHKRGEVEIVDRGAPTGRRVTYQLGHNWQITAQRGV
ncbi:MAG: hypothetical protein EPO21_08150 [Chloroflexota bacterium]|nr:MAG: hypothetical protein EPO21_08150 [Chloroflexota bacterium]